jgi:hypothetical protein
MDINKEEKNILRNLRRNLRVFLMLEIKEKGGL